MVQNDAKKGFGSSSSGPKPIRVTKGKHYLWGAYRLGRSRVWLLTLSLSCFHPPKPNGRSASGFFGPFFGSSSSGPSSPVSKKSFLLGLLGQSCWHLFVLEKHRKKKNTLSVDNGAFSWWSSKSLLAGTSHRCSQSAQKPPPSQRRTLCITNSACAFGFLWTV